MYFMPQRLPGFWHWCNGEVLYTVQLMKSDRKVALTHTLELLHTTFIHKADFILHPTPNFKNKKHNHLMEEDYKLLQWQ